MLRHLSHRLLLISVVAVLCAGAVGVTYAKGPGVGCPCPVPTVKPPPPPTATPSPTPCPPTVADIGVQYDGVDGNGKQTVTIYNRCNANVGSFRVGVFAGAQSYSFFVLGLLPYGYFPMELAFTAECGQQITVIADVDTSLNDPTRADNVVTFYGCQ
jgi:hypothetical protein